MLTQRIRRKEAWGTCMTGSGNSLLHLTRSGRMLLASRDGIEMMTRYGKVEPTSSEQSHRTVESHRFRYNQETSVSCVPNAIHRGAERCFSFRCVVSRLPAHRAWCEWQQLVLATARSAKRLFPTPRRLEHLTTLY